MAEQKEKRATRGGCYCRPEMKGKGRLGRSSQRRCGCGFIIRGKNHEEGDHHNGRVKKCGK